jgi:5-methylcytosine-specific restriction endonuclease McrA
MNKKERDIVYNKYDGKCAYCGCDLSKGWHVDHINPIRRNETDYGIERINRYRATPIIRGENVISNYNPACRQCNIWKSTYSIEQFRNEVSEQINRLNSYSANYRNAKRFGLVEEIIKPVVFYFEKVEIMNVQPIEKPMCGVGEKNRN